MFINMQFPGLCFCRKLNTGFTNTRISKSSIFYVANTRISKFHIFHVANTHISEFRIFDVANTCISKFRISGVANTRISKSRIFTLHICVFQSFAFLTYFSKFCITDVNLKSSDYIFLAYL